MPIDYSGNGYLATDASILVVAFEGVLRELGLVDQSDPAARLVAGQVITFAKAGEHDPVRLRDLTLEALRIDHCRSLRAAIPKPLRLRLLAVAF
jgi:hypothetical protein